MVERLGVEAYLSIGRPKDKNNDDCLIAKGSRASLYIQSR